MRAWKRFWGWSWIAKVPVFVLAFVVFLIIIGLAFPANDKKTKAASESTTTASTTTTAANPQARSRAVSTDQIGSEYDLAATQFNAFWKEWRDKVVPSLIANKPDFDTAEIRAGSYRKFVGESAERVQSWQASDANRAAVEKLAAALQHLRDGTTAAETAAKAKDQKALEAAAETVGTGAKELQEAGTLVNALQ